MRGARVAREQAPRTREARASKRDREPARLAQKTPRALAPPRGVA
jgi:hypothetical protein